MIEFQLDRDIVFFDIESTGLNVLKDRVIQIAFIKYPKSGGPAIELELMINPGIPISAEAMAVHKITPDMVKNKPVFSQVAQEIYDFIGDADLSGYNSDRFDIPMLIEELARAGLDLDLTNRRTIDVQKIFYKMEPRTLKAAYKFFTGDKMENAHDALADVRATVDVLKGQLLKYKDVDYMDKDDKITKAPIQNNMQALYDFTNTGQKSLDITNRLKYNNEGKIVFNFGKYIGQEAAPLLYKDRNYYNWILNKDFSTQVKKIVKTLLADYNAEKNSK